MDKLVTGFIIFVIILFSLISAVLVYERSGRRSVKESSTKIEQHYKVGSIYTICSQPTDDPFDPQTTAVILIVASSGGYVQYCWAHDSASNNRTLFHRSNADFADLISNCK